MGVETTFKLNLKALSSQDNQKSDSEPALKSEAPVEVENTTPIVKVESSIETAKELLLDNSSISSGEENDIEEIEKDDTKSHNISFADIKKQIEKKNSPTEEETIESEAEVTTTTDSEAGQKEVKVDEVIPLQKNVIEDSITPNEEALGAKKIDEQARIENDSENKNLNTPIVPDTNSNIQDMNIKDGNQQETKLEVIKEDDTDAQKDKIAIGNAEKTKAILKQKEEEKTEKKKSFFSRFKRKKGEQDKITTDIATDINGVATEIKKTPSEAVSIEETLKLGEEDNTPKKIVEKVHFSNYESHFKKESTNFLKRFQNFKYTPSTRVGLVIGLVSLTAIVITSLMLVFPEKHSLDIYKASILEMTSKSPETNIIEVQTTTPIQTIPEEIIIPEVIVDTSETSNIENKPNLSTQNTSQEKSKEILRQHLLNKYK